MPRSVSLFSHGLAHIKNDTSHIGAAPNDHVSKSKFKCDRSFFSECKQFSDFGSMKSIVLPRLLVISQSDWLICCCLVWCSRQWVNQCVGCASWIHKFWPLWWRISLSIRVQATRNHVWHVKFVMFLSFLCLRSIQWLNHSKRFDIHSSRHGNPRHDWIAKEEEHRGSNGNWSGAADIVHCVTREESQRRRCYDGICACVRYDIGKADWRLCLNSRR